MHLDELEALALSEDRAVQLGTLIPGTEDYYDAWCVHHQNHGRLEEVDALTARWHERHGATARYERILDRQALLRWPDDPTGSARRIRDRRGVRHAHQQQVQGRVTDHATHIDGARVVAHMEEHAAKIRDLGRFTDAAMPRLLSGSLSDAKRREALGRVDRADIDGILDAICADLSAEKSRGFGSLRVHGVLTLDQLQTLARRMPELLTVEAFVTAWVRRLRPSSDDDWQRDPARYQAYLDRLWDFVGTLEPSFNSLRVHVLYHRLAHARRRGRVDLAELDKYLRLPRQVRYAAAAYLELGRRRGHLARLDAQFDTGLPRVDDDEPLVGELLAQVFAVSDDYKRYAKWLKEDYVRRLFARARILAGSDGMERWGALLDDPGAVQRLRDEVHLDLAADNPRSCGVDEPVALALYVKNVPTLTVKVFAIEHGTYLRARGKEPDTDVDLDGLVPTWEHTETYDDPPAHRVRRLFRLDQLDGPGVWLVEFVGGGKRSRALVRKGSLYAVERLSAAGHALRIVDEAGRPVPDGTVWMQGRSYVPGEDGEVTIPFSTAPSTRTVVLEGAGRAGRHRLQHRSESYTLHAGLHVEREALVRDAKARVTVRPLLLVHGVPMPLELLEDVSLTLTTRDADGVESRAEVRDLPLSYSDEAVHTFGVPEGLRHIHLDLTARVRAATTGRYVDLSVHRGFGLNGIDATLRTSDAHLAYTEAGYVLFVLGKNGEPRRHQPLTLSLYHVDYNDRAQVRLQTDERGRVSLGHLEGFTAVQAELAELTARFSLVRDAAAWPSAVHVVTGQPIALPLPDSALRGAPVRHASLMELRGTELFADRSAAMRVDVGGVHIQPLEPGDYTLRVDGRTLGVRVVDGVECGDWAIGATRHLEVRPGTSLQVAEVAAGPDGIRIALRNHGPDTRVHVYGTRFVAAQPVYPAMSLPMSGMALCERPLQECRYLSGLAIGDEHRYILERRGGKTWPGNMLGRPGLLLNPWARQDTVTGIEQPKMGDRLGAGAPAPAPAMQAAEAEPPGGVGRARAASSNVDFLGPAVYLDNLVPDDEGVVRLDPAAFAEANLLCVVAFDEEQMVVRHHGLVEVDVAPRDLRNLNGLDPSTPRIERKKVTPVAPAGTLSVHDIRTSKVEVYGTVGRVLSLLQSLCPDPAVSTLSFVGRWHTLDDAERRRLYSEHACHELSFFLSRKDPTFFAEVVQPYLRNKHHKTFLDRYLLGDDLGAYLSPWAFSRLNLVERILVGGRIAGRGPGISREIDDARALQPPNPAALEALFRAAVQGSALEAEEGLGIAARARDLSLPAEPVAMMSAGLDGMMLDVDEEAAPKRKAAKQARRSRASRKRADLRARAEMPTLFRAPDPTKELAENNYHHLTPQQSGPDRVALNGFWCDFAAHGEGAFLSPHVAQAAGNVTEVMFAAAVLDVPFEAEGPATAFEGTGVQLTATTPILVFHQEIDEAVRGDQPSPVLISQNLMRADDRAELVDGETRDKYVRGELLVHTVYTCQVVLTNPTSAPLKLDLLLQIPHGALPVGNGFETRGRHLRLGAYATETVEYSFYFPEVGEYPHFPAHVAIEEALVAVADARPLTVVERLSEEDVTAWAWLSQHGDDRAVLDALGTRNLGRLDLTLIAWRMRDRDFYRRALDVLKSRHSFDATLWSYSLLHLEGADAVQWLLNDEVYLDGCGPALSGRLLQIDPVVRHTYEHLEYLPLVHARAHTLGQRRTILNDRLAAQYKRWLDVLVHQRELSGQDWLATAYYLLLLDRVEEGLAALERVDEAEVPDRLQLDYLRAYAAFYVDPAAARPIAERHRDHPVDRWRKRFQDVLAQLAEIEQGSDSQVSDVEDRDQVVGRQASVEPAFELEVDGAGVHLTYANLEHVEVRYYFMDIELLFSRQPFVQQQSTQFAIVQPNHVEQHTLDSGSKAATFDLPDAVLDRNVVVAASAHGIVKTKVHTTHRLDVLVMQRYGQVQVRDPGTGAGVPGAYVKVYARYGGRGKAVQFHKDGYTDHRGRFDYASLSTDTPGRVERFALLVLSERGAVTREVAPPPR